MEITIRKKSKKDLLRNPKRVASFIKMIFNLMDGKLSTDHIGILFFDDQKEVIGLYFSNKIIFHQIYDMAYIMKASEIIVVRNYASGYIKPSEQDKNFAKDISTACNVFNIKVKDYLIIGGNGYFSFLENGLI